MRLNKWQAFFVAGSALLVIVLYFGFDTVPSEQKLVEKSRALNFETADVSNLIRDARNDLGDEELAYIRTLENVANNAQTDTQRVDALQRLSGAWFDLEHYTIAGHFAEQLAEIQNTEESWSIAGSTYGYGLTMDAANAVKDIARERAEICYMNALSINPDNIEHRINIAICNAEHPPPANPMKGIQELLALNKEFPESTAVIYHLARFGLQTGQYERAIERLKTAIRINPEENRLHCLLVVAYTESGSPELAAQHEEQCATEINSKN
jgi:tetratricopeptide (TPR) repeat protein